MNRRQFIAAGAATLAAAYTRPATSQATTTGSLYLGIGVIPDQDPNFYTYATSLEGKLGRRFAAFRRNKTSPITSAVSSYDTAYDHGWHWAYVNGKPSPPNNNYTGYWRATANGAYDAFWNQYFQTVKADTRWSSTQPIHFSYHHEQSVESEGGGLKNGPPSDYVAAFRHVRALMDANRAHVSQGGNMQMVWAPHWLQIKNTGNPFYATKCNPGGGYFDLLGVDIYNTTTATYTAAAQWNPVHTYAASIGKPFFTGEQGIAGSDTKVVAYLKQLDTLLKGYGAGLGSGQVVALNISSHPAAGGDYRMDATPAILAQWRAMALDPFYSRTLP